MRNECFLNVLLIAWVLCNRERAEREITMVAANWRWLRGWTCRAGAAATTPP